MKVYFSFFFLTIVIIGLNACEPPEGIKLEAAPETECGEITFAGKCSGSILKYCEEEKIEEIDCNQINATCSWDEKYQYNTCLLAGTAYPQGELPDTCPKIGASKCVKDSENEVRECVVTTGVAVWNVRKCDDDNNCTTDSCKNGVCQFEYNCPEGSYCNNGKCNQECVPDCEEKECGSDGCGGNCGSCWGKFECDFATSVCRVKCDNGLWCGADEKCCRNACIPSTSTCCEIENSNAAVWCNEDFPACIYDVPEECNATYDTMCCPAPYYGVCVIGKKCDCCVG